MRTLLIAGTFMDEVTHVAVRERDEGPVAQAFFLLVRSRCFKKVKEEHIICGLPRRAAQR